MAFDPSNDYSPFKNVESGENGTVEGRLPLTEPAAGIRYRKEIFIEIALAQFAISPILDLVGSFKNRIRASSEPDALILLEQEVELRIRVVAFVDPFFGSIGFVTWQPLDGGEGIVKTTIINGAPVDPAEAWHYVDVTTPTEFSEHLSYFDFQAEGVATAGGYHMFGTWYSAPYAVDNIQPGAVLERVFDHWGVGSLLDEATFAFSFRAGTPSFSQLFDDVGAIRIANQVGSDVVVSHTYAGGRELLARARLPDLREPSIWKDDTNRIWLAALAGNAYKMFESLDDGRTFRAKQITDRATGKKVDIQIFDENYKYPRTKRLSSGMHIAWGLRDGRIWTKLSPDGIDWSGAARRVQVPPKRTEPFMLDEDPRNASLRLTNAKDQVLKSTDNGDNWTQLP